MGAERRWRGAGQNDLAADPELAAVVLLDAALAITLEALPAFVPELDPKACTWSEAPPVVLAAREIVVHARHLRHLIDDYRHQIERAFNDDDISF
jgi:hypothetical protein